MKCLIHKMQYLRVKSDYVTMHIIRKLPCQGRGRGFESRLALFKSLVFTGLFLLYFIFLKRSILNAGSLGEKQFSQGGNVVN